MALIKLTRLDGKVIWVQPSWVEWIAEPIAGQHPDANAVLQISGNLLFVSEGVAEVAADVDEAMRGK